MSNIENENIAAFVQFDPLSNSKIKFLWTNYFFYTVISIPTSLIGIYSTLTKFLFLPWIFVFGLWAFYVISNIKKTNQFPLYLGLLSFFISFSALFAAYKIATTIMKLSIIDLIFFLSIYSLSMVASILYYIKLIKIGKYAGNKIKSNGMSSLGISITIFPVVLIISRLIRSHISQYTVVLVLLACILIFVQGYLMISIFYFLKYVYSRKMNSLESN